MPIYQNYFRLTEFLVDPDMRDADSAVPVHVVEKIWRYHLPILNRIRHELETPLIISEHSGYRPKEWELQQGRSGDSQHTFIGHGAVDLTCKTSRLVELKWKLAKSDYARVAWYPHKSFFHCDFKDAEQGKKWFEVTEKGSWKYKEGMR